MAMSSNVRKVSTLNWGSALGEAVGARFSTRCERQSNKPAIVITDECVAIKSIAHAFEFKYQGFVTPPTPGAKHDAVAVYQTFINSTGGVGGANLTETLPDAMFDDEHESDVTGEIGVMTLKGHYVGTSLQPRTIA